MRLFNSGCNYGNPTRGLASFNSNNNNTRSNANANIGFRSALPQRQMLRTYWVRFQSRGDKGVCSLGRIAAEK